MCVDASLDKLYKGKGKVEDCFVEAFFCFVLFCYIYLMFEGQLEWLNFAISIMKEPLTET